MVQLEKVVQGDDVEPGNGGMPDPPGPPTCKPPAISPAMPIARPTSDSFSAGASLVPSPVTATTSPILFSVCTSRYLSCGDDRASTCSGTQRQHTMAARHSTGR